MYRLDISDELEYKMAKLLKKDKILYEQLQSKIIEIVNCSDVEHYKNLRYKLKNFKRVHIGHFVLLFRFDMGNNTIHFEDFDHHDKIYLL